MFSSPVFILYCFVVLSCASLYYLILNVGYTTVTKYLVSLSLVTLLGAVLFHPSTSLSAIISINLVHLMLFITLWAYFLFASKTISFLGLLKSNNLTHLSILHGALLWVIFPLISFFIAVGIFVFTERVFFVNIFGGVLEGLTIGVLLFLFRNIIFLGIVFIDPTGMYFIRFFPFVYSPEYQTTIKQEPHPCGFSILSSSPVSSLYEESLLQTYFFN